MVASSRWLGDGVQPRARQRAMSNGERLPRRDARCSERRNSCWRTSCRLHRKSRRCLALMLRDASLVEACPSVRNTDHHRVPWRASTRLPSASPWGKTRSGMWQQLSGAPSSHASTDARVGCSDIQRRTLSPRRKGRSIDRSQRPLFRRVRTRALRRPLEQLNDECVVRPHFHAELRTSGALSERSAVASHQSKALRASGGTGSMARRRSNRIRWLACRRPEKLVVAVVNHGDAHERAERSGMRSLRTRGQVDAASNTAGAPE